MIIAHQLARRNCPMVELLPKIEKSHGITRGADYYRRKGGESK